jgi:hypothetical protein
MLMRPRLPVERPRLSVGRHVPLPAAVLVVGLCLSALIVVSTAGLSPSALLAATRDGFGLYEVGGLKGAWKTEPYSPFVDGRLRGLTVVLAVVYLASAAAIGSVVVAGIRGDDRWPRAVSAVAGLLPGYLMVLAPLQLLFAVLPLLTAAWTALIGLPVIALLVHRRAIRAFATAAKRDRAALRGLGIVVVGIVALAVLGAVHRLQAQNFFLTQDSIRWFVRGADQQLQGLFGDRLAQWNQQSDEWLFNAPLMFSSRTARDFWFSIYATQAVSLASFLALVFGIVHRLARRRKNLAAGVAVAVVFGSTPAIYPWIYVTIVSGDNPVLTTGHPGRLIGIVAPWAALLLLGRSNRSMTMALGLATLGLGFASVQVLSYVVVAVAAGLLWRHLGDRQPGPPIARGVVHLLPPIAIGMIVYVFNGAYDPNAVKRGWWLVGGAAVAVVGAVFCGVQTAGRASVGLPKGSRWWIGAWSAAVVLGVLLSNNMTEHLFHSGGRRALASVFPGYGGPLLSRPDLGVDLLGRMSFPRPGLGCELYNYCHGVPNFLAAFGSLFVVALATWCAFGSISAEPLGNARRVAWLLMVAAIGIGLFLTIFNGASDPVPPLTFSRFMEAPYYGLLALAALTFAESRNRVTLVVGTGVLVAWTVIPLIATQWPEQMVRNSGWFLQRFGVL